ncbi:MAG: glycosyltransferase [Cyanobacteria bacterium J06606_4]
MTAISYVVPTLNSAETLEATLLSLTRQTGVAVNIVVVDSGSTDQTPTICKRWAVPMLYAPPGNMYSAINLGLSQATTPWLAYLNSDDLIYSDSAARLIRHGEQTHADLVYGNCDYIDYQGRFMYSFRPPPPAWLRSILRTGRNGFAQQTVIFRRSLYHSLHGFDDSYQYAADFDFYARAFAQNATFSFLKGPPLACFRLHREQLSQQKAVYLDKEATKAAARLGRLSLADRGVKYLWKLSNTMNYAVRMARQSALARRLTITRSMDGGTHAKD